MPSIIVSTSDLSSTLALLADARGAVRVRGDAFGLRLSHDSIGPAGLDQVDFSRDLDADFGPSDLLVFGQVNEGAVGFRAEGAERWHARGDVYLAGPAGRERTSLVRAGRHQQVVLPAALVSQVAQASRGRREADGVRFTGYQAVSRQAAALWESTYGYVRDITRSSPDAPLPPLLASSMTQLLVAVALRTFANDAVTDPDAQDRLDGSPVTLRRAVAFIDEHAHQDITIADIAAAASVTIRAVQLAFRRHLDTTPTEYLRRVRLDHAHRQLAAADARHESVTEVAYRWGFASPSRFAALYRRAYGVRPSTTLRS